MVMTDNLLSACICGYLDEAKAFVKQRKAEIEVARGVSGVSNEEDCICNDAVATDKKFTSSGLAEILNSDYAYRRGKYSPLAIASLHGHIEIVRFLLDHGADAHRLCGRRGYSVLGMAARNGHSQIVETLLEEGCDPNTPTYVNGKTCLYVATVNNHVQVVRILLEGGADVRHSTNKSILHEACWRGHYEVVRLLVEAGLDVNCTNSEGYAPLLAAAEGGHLEIVKLLVANKANVNAYDSHYRDTALHKAVELGCLDMFQILFEAGAAVFALNSNRESPFSMAILNSQEEMVRQIIQARPYACREQTGQQKEKSSCIDNFPLMNSNDDDYSRNSCGGDGSTSCSIVEWEGEGSVHCAVRSGNLEIVKMLVQDGANVTQLDDRQRTPLHYACYSGNVKAAELLLQSGAILDSKNTNGMTPLHLAVQEGHVELVHLFLLHERLVDVRRRLRRDSYPPLDDAVNEGIVNLLDNHERTPLHLAAGLGRLDMVERILHKHDAILTKMDRWRRTPLHVATEAGHLEIVRLLLNQNATVLNQVDKSGFTPLHTACERGRMDLILLFLDSGAKVDSADVKGSTPLHIASRLRNLDVVNLLLAYQAPVDKTDFHGRTPLHICAESCHLEILNALLRHSNRVDLPDLNGWTPVALACVKGDVNVVKFFIEMHMAGDRASILHIRHLLLGH